MNFRVLFLFFLSINFTFATKGFLPFKGVAEVPVLFGNLNQYGPPGDVKAVKGIVNLYSKPSLKSKILYTFKNKPISADNPVTEDLLAKIGKIIRIVEFNYEFHGVEVCGRSNGWTQVELKDLDLIKATGKRHVWINPQSTTKFHSYKDLIKEGLSYLHAKNWNGNLYSSADYKKVLKFDSSKKVEPNYETDIKLISLKDNWAHIEVYDSNMCVLEDPKEKPKLITKAWVPATNLKGRPTMWFYSRGC